MNNRWVWYEITRNERKSERQMRKENKETATPPHPHPTMDSEDIEKNENVREKGTLRSLSIYPVIHPYGHLAMDHRYLFLCLSSLTLSLWATTSPTHRLIRPSPTYSRFPLLLSPNVQCLYFVSCFYPSLGLLSEVRSRGRIEEPTVN